MDVNSIEDEVIIKEMLQKQINLIGFGACGCMGPQMIDPYDKTESWKISINLESLTGAPKFKFVNLFREFYDITLTEAHAQIKSLTEESDGINLNWYVTNNVYGVNPVYGLAHVLRDSNVEFDVWDLTKRNPRCPCMMKYVTAYKGHWFEAKIDSDGIMNIIDLGVVGQSLLTSIGKS